MVFCIHLYVCFEWRSLDITRCLKGWGISIAHNPPPLPPALIVVSESLYGHNGNLEKMWTWPLHFKALTSEFLKQIKKVYEPSSPDGRMSQETLTRRFLETGVHNLYQKRESLLKIISYSSQMQMRSCRHRHCRGYRHTCVMKNWPQPIFGGLFTHCATSTRKS